MKIALAQMNVIAGAMEQNKETMLRLVADAKRQKADLIVFPEMCTHGYLVGDKWLSSEFCRVADTFIDSMRQASHGIAIAWGSIYLDDKINDRLQEHGYHPNKDGRARRYNAVHVMQDGQEVARRQETNLLPKGVVPKTLLPNYRIFDDQRYFFSLSDVARDHAVPLSDLVQPHLIKDRDGHEIPIQFEICEDMWAQDYRENGAALNVTKIGINNGAELVVNLSASPWTYGKNSARDRRVKFLQGENGVDAKPFFYVNCVGVQNNGKNFVTFDGGSTVYNRQGQPIDLARSPYSEELMLIDTEEIDQAEPLERDQVEPIAEKYLAIIEGIRALKDVQGRSEHPTFLIGLSGGIDSAVVAALLVKAVGAERVVAVNMPTQWNSQATQDAAANIAEALGIEYYQAPIADIVQSVETTLDGHILRPRKRTKLTSLAQENIQAKIRGTDILSNLAGNHGWLMTNNGNKLEIALGYATLYGDVNGAIAPIGDLLKSEVFALAHFINDSVYEKEVITTKLLPDTLFQFKADQIKPSAELEADQEDPMKFGYHDALLALATDYQKWEESHVLRAYLDGSLHHHIGKALGKDDEHGLQIMQRWGIDQPQLFAKDLQWFFSTMNRNVFKRVQAPGIVITSRSSFGFDIRESMLPYSASQETEALRGRLSDYRPA